MTWDRRLYFPSEWRRAKDFFALKIRRLWPGVNPRTWVPKASTLPLDHKIRFGTRVLHEHVYLSIPFTCTADHGFPKNCYSNYGLVSPFYVCVCVFCTYCKTVLTDTHIVVNNDVQLALPVEGRVTHRDPTATLQLLGASCIQTSSTLLYSGSRSHKSRCKRALKPVSSVLPPAHTFTYVVCVVQPTTKLHSNFVVTQLLYSGKCLHILFADYMCAPYPDIFQVSTSLLVVIIKILNIT
jgi:hypothetical protein